MIYLNVLRFNVTFPPPCFSEAVGRNEGSALCLEIPKYESEVFRAAREGVPSNGCAFPGFSVGLCIGDTVSAEMAVGEEDSLVL